MPLSEHEQRQLEAIERALYADDPKFAHTVRFTDPRLHGRRRLATGVVLVVLGLGVLLAGAVLALWYVGVLGFLIMLGGASRAYAGLRRLASHPSPSPSHGSGSQPAGRRRSAIGRTGLRDWFEQRWHRRLDGGNL